MVTLSGIVTVLNEVQLPKAHSPILFTSLPMIYSVTVEPNILLREKILLNFLLFRIASELIVTEVKAHS